MDPEGGPQTRTSNLLSRMRSVYANDPKIGEQLHTAFRQGQSQRFLSGDRLGVAGRARDLKPAARLDALNKRLEQTLLQ